MTDPIQEIANQLGIQTFGDGLLAKIRQTIDLLQEAAAERDQLRAEVERLEDALETETMRLAACGVAALGYFQGCAEEYDSASLRDVLALRAQLAQQLAVPEGWREFLEEMSKMAPPYGAMVAMTSSMALGSKARRLLAATPAPQAEPASPWVAVTERLPDPATYSRVLIFTEGFDFAGQQVFDVDAQWLADKFAEQQEEVHELLQAASHWMPLPKSPEVKA